MNILRLTDIDSTNLEARRRIEDGECGPLWIIADRQSAGRGRFDREWISPSGNLYSSLILQPGRPLKEVAILSLLAGVAVQHIVATCLPDKQVLLKWPNDVLIDGAKIAGLLLETVGGADDPVLIVGIGINVVSAPKGLPYPATSLADHREGVELEAVFLSLRAGFEALWNIFLEQGFAPIREEWLANTVDLGTPIHVRLPEKSLEGEFGGLDDTGALLLNKPDGPLAIMAGDVFFAPSEPERES